MNRRILSGSTAFKLAVAFMIAAAVQSILMSVILIFGGVITQSKDNAYQIFSEKVSGRSDSLENEIKNVWTNFDHYTDQICLYFTKENREAGTKQTDQVLEDMSSLVMDALYYTKTTGAFLILKNRDGGDSHPALYFRNANPNINGGESSNIYLLTGPWGVSEKMGIVTAKDWSYRLELDEENRDFYDKPFKSIDLAEDEKFLGYLSPPFSVTPGGERVMTYSVPLKDYDGNPIGVFGVEISVEYLYKFLPAADLQAADSYGYILGMRRDGEEPLYAAVTHGVLQDRMLQQNLPLQMELKDKEKQIYRLKNHNGGDEVYACLNQLGMYYNNTPFAGDEWFLVGLMEGSSLLRYPGRIRRILIYSFFVSLLVGAAVAVIISRWFTKYSRLIELSEVPVGVFEMGSRNNRVYMTNQVPKLLGLTREQERQFCKDKIKFGEFLRMFCRTGTDEANVYRSGDLGQNGWIRITVKTEADSITGIIEDVTDEVLQKKTLKMERDYDSLTGVKNRRAFKQQTEEWSKQPDPERKLCIMMLDLNELKEVNDVFGHDKGDEYICFASDAIRDAFRESQIYRIGGDEFVAASQDIPEEEIISSIKVMKTSMEQYRQTSGFDAGLACGYAFYDPQNDENLEKTLLRADMNMYKDKRRMKN